jgi:Styrene monooxygenase A putative substrate binding domain
LPCTALAGRHELIVIASGKAGLAGMFPLRADKMPYDKPMRRLCGGFYHGVAYSAPKGVTMSIAPATASCWKSRCSRPRDS